MRTIYKLAKLFNDIFLDTLSEVFMYFFAQLSGVLVLLAWATMLPPGTPIPMFFFVFSLVWMPTCWILGGNFFGYVAERSISIQPNALWRLYFKLANEHPDKAIKYLPQSDVKEIELHCLVNRFLDEIGETQLEPITVRKKTPAKVMAAVVFGICGIVFVSWVLSLVYQR